MGEISDPFYSTKFTGRGLAVAMGLVKAWGGTLCVNSTVGEGSCFSLFLPLVAETVPRPTRKVSR